jgi:hypothetical protein
MTTKYLLPDAEDRTFCDELNKLINRYGATVSASFRLDERTGRQVYMWCSAKARNATRYSPNCLLAGKGRRTCWNRSRTGLRAMSAVTPGSGAGRLTHDMRTNRPQSSQSAPLAVSGD